MSLIRRAIRVFYGLKHEERFVESRPQISSASLGAPEIRHYLSMANAYATGTNAGTSSDQANIYQANQMAEGRSEFKEYDGALSGLDHQIGAAYVNASGALTHRFPLGLKARFGRSCRAFVNAWRAP